MRIINCLFVLLVGAAVSDAAVASELFGVRRALKGHTGTVLCSTFSSKGQLLATGDHKGLVVVWDVETGKEVFRCDHRRSVRAVAFSLDSSEIAIGGTGSQWSIWDLRRKTRMTAHMLPFETSIRSLHFTASRDPVVIKEQSGLWFQWDPSNDITKLLTKPGEWRHDASLSPDRTTIVSPIASGEASVTLNIMEFKTGKHLASLLNHPSKFPQLTFSRDAAQLVAISPASRNGKQRGIVELWSLFDRKRTFVISHALRSARAAVSSDNRFICGVGGPVKATDPSVVFWERSSKRVVGPFFRDGAKAAFIPKAAGFTCTVAAHPNENIFATGGAGGVVSLWALK